MQSAPIPSIDISEITTKQRVETAKKFMQFTKLIPNRRNPNLFIVNERELPVCTNNSIAISTFRSALIFDTGEAYIPPFHSDQIVSLSIASGQILVPTQDTAGLVGGRRIVFDSGIELHAWNSQQYLHVNNKFVDASDEIKQVIGFGVLAFDFYGYKKFEHMMKQSTVTVEQWQETRETCMAIINRFMLCLHSVVYESLPAFSFPFFPYIHLRAEMSGLVHEESGTMHQRPLANLFSDNPKLDLKIRHKVTLKIKSTDYAISFGSLERAQNMSDKIENLKNVSLFGLLHRCLAEFSNADFDLSLLCSWTVIEALIKEVYESQPDEPANKKKKVTKAYAREQWLTQSLNVSWFDQGMADRTSDIRTNRNKFIHEQLPISIETCKASMVLATELLQLCHSIQVHWLVSCVFVVGTERVVKLEKYPAFTTEIRVAAEPAVKNIELQD